MTCAICGQTVSDSAFYCQWCGAELSVASLDLLTKKIRWIQRDHNIEANRIINKAYLDVAWLVYQTYISESYLSKYPSFIEYGERELNLKRAAIYLYKEVGEKFFDRDGKLRVSGGYDWSIGRLAELRPLGIGTINKLITQGIINPQMSSKQLREIVCEYK